MVIPVQSLQRIQGGIPDQSVTAGTCHCQVQDVELVRKVGQGAFGVVYHARVHQTDYACKSGPQNCTNHVFFF